MDKYNNDVKTRASQLRVIDDTFFRLIARRKEVCQEILRTLLDDEHLEVLSTIAQATITGTNRGAVLDALCKTKDETICNIEMQKTDHKNDIKRVRFYSSIITTDSTPTGSSFSQIPTVKTIYITEYDALGNNQSLTHITRCQNNNGIYTPIDDGEEIILANTYVNDDSNYSELLQLFLRRDSFKSEKFPELSKAVAYYKDSKEGITEVCRIVEEYAEKVAAQVAAERLIMDVENVIINFRCTLQKACDALCTTIEDYENAKGLVAQTRS